jgi:hypothetical protein
MVVSFKVMDGLALRLGYGRSIVAIGVRTEYYGSARCTSYSFVNPALTR